MANFRNSPPAAATSFAFALLRTSSRRPPCSSSSSHRSMMAVARPPLSAVGSVADAATWYAALVLGMLVLLSSLQEGGPAELDEAGGGRLVLARPCDEIYVVGDGETLHSISDKCGDPFIVERNPHIHDPDDVFPGLVIMITPSKPPV